MPRSTTSHHTKGKSDHGHSGGGGGGPFSSGWSMKSSSRRGSKVVSEDGGQPNANDAMNATPSKGLDRHARMKLAMAETLNDDDEEPQQQQQQQAQPPRGSATNGSESPRTKIAAEQAQAKAQAAIAQAQVAAARGDIDAARRQRETPGEGSLTFDALGNSGDVVLADGVPPTPTLAPSESNVTTPQPDAAQPSRSDSMPAFSSHAHARGASEAAYSKRAASLMVPSDDPSAHGHTRARTDHLMHPSQSTSALLSARPRTLSDASSSADGRQSPTKSRKSKPGAGGIASALAASGAGMAGMGMTNPSAYAEAHARAVAAAAQARAKTPSGTKVEKDYVGSSQGGVYRDPKSGVVTEKDELGQEVRYHPRDVSRSSSSQGGSVKNEGHNLVRPPSAQSMNSEGSSASGLAAAANFPAMQAGALLTPALSHTANVHGAPTIALDSSHAEPSSARSLAAIDGASTAAQAGSSDAPDSAATAGTGWPSDVGSQITGFAVASSKRNSDFHALFPSVPDDDYLIEDYGCALVREVFIQGRLYVSENHICFYANIFGWVTNIVVPFSETVAIEKRMTALIIPNAIQIATLHAKHTFSSFITRDATYDLVANIWKLSHPDVPSAAAGAAAAAAAAAGEAESEEDSDVDEQKSSKPSKRSKLRKKLKGKKDVDATSPTKGKANGSAKNSKEAPSSSGDTANGGAAGATAGKGGADGKKPRKTKHAATSCPCENEKKHLSTIALDTTYPTTPVKLFALLFGGSGSSAPEDSPGGGEEFMRKFWTDNQKLFDLELGPWKPVDGGRKRDLSYIKPLAGGFGPKQTKCVISDEEVHIDPEEYITVLTTTRTPDVPSGGSFCVRTRTCITWAGKGTNDARVYVTCATEWSGRSMLKGVIDKASIDGQKGYYGALDGELRGFIKQHASEMKEPGDSDDEEEDEEEEEEEEAGADEKSKGAAATPAPSAGASSTAASGALAALGPLGDILGPILEPMKPFLPDSSPSLGSLALMSLVALLLISNIWAWGKAPQRDPLDPHRLRTPAASTRAKHSSHATESAEAVAHAVRDVLHEYLGGGHPRHGLGGLRGSRYGAPEDDPWLDVQGVGQLLDEAEARLAQLRHRWELESKRGREIESEKQGGDAKPQQQQKVARAGSSTGGKKGRGAEL